MCLTKLSLDGQLQATCMSSKSPLMRLAADRKDREASHEAMDLAKLRLRPKSRNVSLLKENTHKLETKWKKYEAKRQMLWCLKRDFRPNEAK